MEKQNVLLVFGGSSFEHDISIITALIIYNGAKNSKYNLLPVYIDKNNEWFFYERNNLNLSKFKDFSSLYLKNGFKKIFIDNKHHIIKYKAGIINKEINYNVVLNCCHGGIGECGTLNSFFNICKVPVSSGSEIGMQICMNKIISKAVFNGFKIPVIKSFFVNKDSLKDKKIINEKLKNIGFPVILKPANLGSSIGIKVVQNSEEFYKSIEETFLFDDSILIEKAILDDMEELNVACLRVGNNIIVSDIDKPVKSDEILSFKDKYGESNDYSKMGKINTKNLKSKGGYLSAKPDFPYKTDSKVENKIKTIAKNLYKILNLSGPVRFDYILDKNKNVYLNEINAVPGSLAYYFFVPFVFKNISEFVDSILDSAIYNYTENKIDNNYNTNLF